VTLGFSIGMEKTKEHRRNYIPLLSNPIISQATEHSINRPQPFGNTERSRITIHKIIEERKRAFQLYIIMLKVTNFHSSPII
jgi:hypothetical protein